MSRVLVNNEFLGFDKTFRLFQCPTKNLKGSFGFAHSLALAHGTNCLPQFGRIVGNSHASGIVTLRQGLTESVFGMKSSIRMRLKAYPTIAE
jgi:hypothetical protein